MLSLVKCMKSSFVHSADLCRGGVRVRVRVRVRAVIDRYAILLSVRKELTSNVDRAAWIASSYFLHAEHVFGV